MRKYGCAISLALACGLACCFLYATYSVAVAIGTACVGAIAQAAVTAFWSVFFISVLLVAFLGLAFLSSPLEFAWTWLPILLRIWDHIVAATA
jgi:hypothetical protein